jgi:hypothetical protein
MNKEFIPYEQALALKELGFDEPCLASWTYKTKERIPTLYGCGALLFDTDGLITNQTEDVICSAPLYQQAFRWFREKHGLGHMINGSGFESFLMNIGGIIAVFPMFRTYEEAELACLKKLIEIVKQPK